VTPLPPQQLEVSQQQNATPSPVTAPPSAVTPGTPAVAGAQGGQQTPTIGTVQAQNPQGQKQMVEVKSLGQNTVTFKGNQMIVSGPDIAQAQLIAKQVPMLFIFQKTREFFFKLTVRLGNFTKFPDYDTA
jgi:hypothetical protein